MDLQLVSEVIEELKDILPISHSIEWVDSKSTSYVGRCYWTKKKIAISVYLKNKQDIKDTIAHELIHMYGIHGHGKEFKEYCDKINALGLGYNVKTTAKEVTNLDEIRKIRKEKREQRKTNGKQYITWCKCCGHAWISTRKHRNINRWKCASCGGKLGQKIYREGVTIRYGKVLG